MISDPSVTCSAKSTFPSATPASHRECLEGTKLLKSRKVVSPDGRLVDAGVNNSLSYVRSADTGAVFPMLPGHDMEVTGDAFSGEGAQLVTGSKDGTAIGWSLGST